MVTPRARVIIDNDFSGDPDDLFQFVHHLLSPSVTIPFVIGSHLSPNDPFDSSTQQAENAARIATEVLEIMGMPDATPVYQGSNIAMSSPIEPIDTPAARAIVNEALRDDTDLPLYIALGAGLTELASALLLEPRIADRLTAVWIGGSEHAGLASPPPGADPVEYNLNIDVAAAQTVFNESSIELWQCPRDVYRQCLVSRVELEYRVRPMGAIGRYMAEAIDRLTEGAHEHGLLPGETYALGDSPLVLLTALQAAFQPDPSSSHYQLMPTPRLSADGQYEYSSEGRLMRVYTQVDQRLMFEDFFLKLRAFTEGAPLR